MASYTIHIAIAKEVLRKNKGYNEEKFIKGTIAPDLVKDKSKTHFAKLSSESNWGKFLKFYSLDKGYYSGWFLHLITDRLFYEEYLNDWENRDDADGEKLYEDYDIINEAIIEKYNIPLVEEVKDYMFYRKKGKLTYIDKETLYQFIDEISSINLQEYEQRAKRYYLK